MLNCFSNPKWKKTKISRSFDQLAVLFQRKFSEDKVKSESFDRFVKTNQQNETKMKQWKQRTAGYYSLLWILVKESTQMNTKKLLFTIEFVVDHLRWSTQTQWKKSVQKITIAESKGGLKTQRKLWTAEGYLHKEHKWTWLLWTVSEAQWSTQSTKMKAERTRVWINAKVEFFWERELNTKCCTQKIDCGSGCRSTQLNWMDTEKWSSCC